MKDTKEVHFILASTYPFSKLERRTLTRLLQISESADYGNNEIIYKEGSAPDYLYVLLKGRVAVSTNIDSLDHDIEILKRGTCFGIISLLTGDPHSVTARSIENSSVLKIPKDTFKEFLQKAPLLSLELSCMLSQRVKARSKPKQIFQSKKIAITGSNPECITRYIDRLSAALFEQTRKKCIGIAITEADNNIFSDDAHGHSLFCRKPPLSLKNFTETHLQEHISKSDVDYLHLYADDLDNFASLLNFLSENYHFILYWVPYAVLIPWHDYALVPADQVHFLIDADRADFQEVSLRLQTLKKKSPLNQEKIKVLTKGFIDTRGVVVERRKKFFNQPIYASLPVSDKETQEKTFRRIARQVGDITLGLALGSGAAYGYAHIGVLKVLIENNITVDIICGSSMGAIIGALWAAGHSIPEVIAMSHRLGKQLGKFAFTGFSFPFKGIMRAKRLESIFKDAFGTMNFCDLKHTLKIVAFDFRQRKTIILDQGLVYQAAAASCAFPGFFEPVRFKKDILLDGGILHPLPTKILLEFSTHKIIASNITLSQEEAQRHYSRRDTLHIFDFIFGSIETMQQQFVQEAVKIADVTVHPHLEGLGWLEFDEINEFILRGEQATREKIEEIRNLL